MNGIPEEMTLKLSKNRRRGSTKVLQTCHKLASCVHYEKTTKDELTSCDRHCDLATRKATGKLIQNLKFPEENERSILEIKKIEKKLEKQRDEKSLYRKES